MTEPRQDEERGVTPRIVIGLVLLAAVVAFILDNTREVRVGYVFGETDVRLIVVLLIVLLVGMFVGYLGARRR